MTTEKTLAERAADLLADWSYFARTGRNQPSTTVTEAIAVQLRAMPLHNHAGQDDLLAAAKAQHRAIDILMAMLIERDPTFMPTKSVIWPALLQGHAAIEKAEAPAMVAEQQTEAKS